MSKIPSDRFQRVLFMNWRDIHHPLAGGAEVYVHETARAMVQDGRTVTILAPRVPGRPDDEVVDGVRLVRRGNRVTIYAAVKSFWARNSLDFDLVVDTVNTRPFLTPTFVTGASIIALIFQTADDVWHHHFPRPIAALGKSVFEPRWLSHYRNYPVATISDSSLCDLTQHGLENLSIVPVGVSLPDGWPDLQVPAREPNTALFLGRLAHNKRPWDAIAAVEEARRSVADVRLWVVGGGPLEPQLRERAPSWAQVCGRVSDVQKFELLARASVLLVPSVREGWGMVVSEAATVGTPVVAYDVPGLRDSVRSVGGILVPANPSSMARALVDHLHSGSSCQPKQDVSVTWHEVAQSLLAVAGGDNRRDYPMAGGAAAPGSTGWGSAEEEP